MEDKIEVLPLENARGQQMCRTPKCRNCRNCPFVNVSIGKAMYYIRFASTTDNPLKEDLALSSLSLY